MLRITDVFSLTPATDTPGADTGDPVTEPLTGLQMPMIEPALETTAQPCPDFSTTPECITISDTDDDDDHDSVSPTVSQALARDVERESRVPTFECGLPRRKYKLFSMEDKRKILQQAKSATLREVARAWKIRPSTISTWRKTLNTDRPRHTSKAARVIGGGRRKTYNQEKEDEVFSWVLCQRDQEIAVGRQDIQRQASRVITPTQPGFKASAGWLEKFMKRNRLSLRVKTSASQKLPADLERRIGIFRNYLSELYRKETFDASCTINMDETPMYFDMPSKKTVEQIGLKDARIRTTGSEKKHLTVVLAVAADGTFLPPMVIFKGVRPIKVTAPPGWVVTQNCQGWMNEGLMLEWTDKILRPHTQRRPAILVLDSFAAHTTRAVDERLMRNHVTPATIPGGCTSKLQPLDVSVNKSFKGFIRQKWALYMQDQPDGPLVHVKKPSAQLMIDWLEYAWEQVSRDVIRRSFAVTGIIPGRDIPIGVDESDSDESFTGFENNVNLPGMRSLFDPFDDLDC